MTSVESLLDEDRRPYYKVTSPKFKASFVVKKSEDGFCHYSISLEGTSGKLPRILKSQFTRPDIALRELHSYINSADESKAVRRDNYQESKKTPTNNTKED